LTFISHFVLRVLYRLLFVSRFIKEWMNMVAMTSASVVYVLLLLQQTTGTLWQATSSEGASSCSQSGSAAVGSADMKEMENLIKSLMSGDTSLLTQQLSGLDVGSSSSCMISHSLWCKCVLGTVRHYW